MVMKDLVKLAVAVAVTVALIPLLPAVSTKGAEHSFLGNRKCRTCHIKEYRSWEGTKMAKALDILKPGQRAEAKTAAGLDPDKDYSKDAKCLPCHTTGHGKDGGFVDVESTPNHVGVGCEMCHGAGGTYVQDQYMSLKNKNYKKAELVAVGLVGEITAETCTGQCHNENNPTNPDEVFDYETRKNEGIHEIFPLKYEHE
jgi:hypothetical protein